jgi:hypothetical protein
MDTVASVEVGVGAISTFSLVGTAAAANPACSSESPACMIDEHCTINPKKIQLNQSRPYQCKVTTPSE